MARQPRQAALLDEATLPDSAAPEPVTETLTYVPGKDDPAHVVWGGHTFHANIPVELTGHAEGTSREQLNHKLIESARGNKHFLVGDQKRRRETASIPRTAEEYRAHAIEWLKKPFEHAEDLIAKLAQERPLQAGCEVGTDDFEYLGSLFMPKLHELTKADELNEHQVASIWMRHGYNVLPW